MFIVSIIMLEVTCLLVSVTLFHGVSIYGSNHFHSLAVLRLLANLASKVHQDFIFEHQRLCCFLLRRLLQVLVVQLYFSELCLWFDFSRVIQSFQHRERSVHYFKRSSLAIELPESRYFLRYSSQVAPIESFLFLKSSFLKGKLSIYYLTLGKSYHLDLHIDLDFEYYLEFQFMLANAENVLNSPLRLFVLRNLESQTCINLLVNSFFEEFLVSSDQETLVVCFICVSIQNLLGLSMDL